MEYQEKVTDEYGHKLEVISEIPNRGQKFPTIILVPGFGADVHEFGYFDQISDILVKNGFQTVRFSFEGTGNSTGSFIDMTVEKQVSQLKTIVAKVASDRFTNTEHIGLLAHQFGVSTTMAALPLSQIKSFVFTGALAHPDDSFGRWFRRQRGYNQKGVSARELADNTKLEIGSSFWKSLSHFSFVSLARKITQPVLFLHGMKDQRVKFLQANEYYNVINSRKKFLVIEKADHAFTGKFRARALEIIKDWFLETLV